MTEFLPNGSLYVFLGVASVLFAIMIGCFGFFKGRQYLRERSAKKSPEKSTDPSFKRKTKRNKFLMKKGEQADKDEENTAETNADKVKAAVDAKYNNQINWITLESIEQSVGNEN